MLKPVISIVSPVYRAEKIVAELVKQIKNGMANIGVDYEIILVDDRSPDKSWQVIEQICKEDKIVKGARLSRNFGQHYAISAGLSLAQGEWIVVMDCDLQDRPDQIGKLYSEAISKNVKIVLARRSQRQDNVFKKMSSKLFHIVFRYLSGIKTDRSVANYGIYNKVVIDQVNQMAESSRSFPGLIDVLGFSRSYIDVPHASRFEGGSSYTFAKLIKLTIDVSISNTNKPLHFTVKLGFFMATVSILLAIYNILAHWFGIITVEGFTSTMFSIWFVGGVILFTLGIIGLYVGKIFDQVKGRPLFVFEDKINVD